MYGPEYEEWREQAELERSALGKLTEDELRAMQKMVRRDDQQAARDEETRQNLMRAQAFNQQSYYGGSASSLRPFGLGYF